MKKNGNPEVPPGRILSEFLFGGERGCGGDSGEKVNSHAIKVLIGGGKVTQKQVKDSLLEQLELQNKTSDFYTDLVNDYIYYWNLKKKMQDDIKINGLRVKSTSGNGFEITKPNESVNNLPKITTTMLKILNDLNLREPLFNTTVEDDYL